MSNSQINIVITGNFPYPHGFAGTRRVQQFIDELHNNYALSVLILRGKPQLDNNKHLVGLNKGVEYRIIGSDINLNWLLIPKIISFLLSGFFFLYSRRKQSRFNILLHYGQPSIENIWLLITAKLMGYRIVHDIVEDYSLFDCSELHFLSRIKQWTKKYLCQFIPTISNGIIVISAYLEKKYNKCGKPLIRIPIAAEVSDDQIHTRNDPLRITYAGTFAAKDGIDVLLKAFQIVRDRYPSCILYLVGGSKNPLDKFDENIKCGVEYKGYMDDESFNLFLKESDILCMTRLNSPFANAGFPFKLGEYLSTGNPVVATNVSNIEEYLSNREDVMLVNPEDIEELSEAILYLLLNPSTAKEIGVKGREACRKHFNPNKNGKNLRRFLEEILV